MPGFCTVRQKITAYEIDGADSNLDPDEISIAGKVVFTPLMTIGDSVIIDEGDSLKTTVLFPIEAEIKDGQIHHNGSYSIKLFAGGPDCNPSTIRYRASYRGLTANDKPVKLRDIVFEVKPGEIINLTDVQPVAGTPGLGTTVGPPGPVATIVSNEILPDRKVRLVFSDGTIITIPSPEDGETPYVKDGNWWVGEHDTGVVADGVDQVRNALSEQISTIESNADRAETAASNTENAIARNNSKGQQMIVNGNGQLGNDYWLSPPPAVVTDDFPLGAYASWERPGGQLVLWHALPIVIDPSKPVYMSGFFRQAADATGTCYLALAPVDQDGQTISAMNIMYIPGTLTTLAQDINPGDTTVYLESAANWANTGTGEANKRFIFWNHVSAGGKVWEPETYSRNVSTISWEAGGINFEDNTVTLKAPWSREFIPAGTSLSNGNNGANYMYARMSSGVGSAWEKLEGTIQGGVDRTGQGFATGRGWPPGVSAVRPGVLINYSNSQGTSNHRFANLHLSQTAPLGHTHTVSDILDI